MDELQLKRLRETKFTWVRFMNWMDLLCDIYLRVIKADGNITVNLAEVNGRLNGWTGE